ncbi:MAG: tetratricopeptide repeat protein [Gemmatimonadales bacterium]|nr:MAG: tetratricopeptide repeat protein [Gemmatimonadales bacterium]
MSPSRLETFTRMLESRPDDPRLRFGIAMEYLTQDRLEEGVNELRRYLALTEDEGNAWGRLGAALRSLGRDDEAREAYEKGIDAARRHAHPTMVDEFQEILDDWD